MSGNKKQKSVDAFREKVASLTRDGYVPVRVKEVPNERTENPANSQLATNVSSLSSGKAFIGDATPVPVSGTGTDGLGYIAWGKNNSLPNLIAWMVEQLPYTTAGVKFNVDTAAGLGPQFKYKWCRYVNGIMKTEMIDYADAGELLRNRLLEARMILSAYMQYFRSMEQTDDNGDGHDGSDGHDEDDNNNAATGGINTANFTPKQINQTIDQINEQLDNMLLNDPARDGVRKQVETLQKALKDSKLDGFNLNNGTNGRNGRNGNNGNRSAKSNALINPNELIARANELFAASGLPLIPMNGAIPYGQRAGAPRLNSRTGTSTGAQVANGAQVTNEIRLQSAQALMAQYEASGKQMQDEWQTTDMLHHNKAILKAINVFKSELDAVFSSCTEEGSEAIASKLTPKLNNLLLNQLHALRCHEIANQNNESYDDATEQLVQQCTEQLPGLDGHQLFTSLINGVTAYLQERSELKRQYNEEVSQRFHAEMQQMSAQLSLFAIDDKTGMPIAPDDKDKADEDLSTEEAVNDSIIEHLRENVKRIKEDLKVWENTNGEVRRFLEENDLNLTLLKLMVDDAHMDISFPELELSQGRTKEEWNPKITGIRHRPCTTCRLEQMDSLGVINYVYVSNQWRLFSATTERMQDLDIYAIPALDPEGALRTLRRQVRANKNAALKNRPTRFILPTYYPSMSHPYYPQPSWWSIFPSRIFQYANTLMGDKATARENSTMFGHLIYVHNLYLESLYSQNEAKTPEEKNAVVDKLWNDVNDFLSKKENHGKTFMAATFQSNDGRTVKGVEIVPVQDAVNGADTKDELEEIASIIFFAMEVHPALIGAIPGKSGSSGGTYHRELFLLKQLRMWPRRKRMLRPLEITQIFNGWDTHGVWTIPDMVLTTLDRSATGLQEQNNG